MRRAVILICALLATSLPSPAHTQPSGRPVVFVHGMGSSAADVGSTQFAELLQGLATTSSGTCQEDAQPDRPWEGSPCVFRYVEDLAETDEGPNDSQSGVRDNADKLASEIEEVFDGERIVLIGYSMGGAIIRTYLALHREAAEEMVDAVVLIDAVASGSWGYAFAAQAPRRIGGGALGDRLQETLRSIARTTSSVDFTRPATRDLSPRSELYREIAPMDLPSNISYYTFWGDIRVVVERNLLHYELPSFDLPSVGDLGLLPGDPDPTVLPELGGQRFSPPVDDDQVALDIPHRARIGLNATFVGRLLDVCGHATADENACGDLLARFSIPNTHTAVPVAMDEITVDVAELGGDTTLLDATLRAVRRHG